MKSEGDFSTNGLLYHCKNPGQTSHESIDSGCCDVDSQLGLCHQKSVFNAPFNCVLPTATTTPQQPTNNPPMNLNPYPTPKRATPTKHRGPLKRDESNSTNDHKEDGHNESSGPPYKYLTWREKDRRRRFREEWKHLWLVVPHGMYEVMCLVCKKIMTQRKLDTIKRHTIRRHAELLSMSDMERQRLYNELVSHYFRRGGDMCSEGEPFSSASAPKMRTMGARNDLRRNPRLPSETPSSAFRSRITGPPPGPPSRGVDSEKTAFMNPLSASESFTDSVSPSMNMKLVENLLSNQQLQSAFSKYFMGLQPNQNISRGKFDPSANPIGRRHPFPHTCGMGTPHAFQVFRKQPTVPFQRGPISEPHSDVTNNRAPLDMTTSNATSPIQVTPDDLSVSRHPIENNAESGASLSERLMRLMNTWDSAALTSKSMPYFPPALPTSIPLLPPLIAPQFDGTSLMLNR